MIFFILTEVIVLLVIIGLLLILSGVWPPDSPWAPWWQMPEEVISKMCALAKISTKDTVYDLGCGTGHAIIYAAKNCGAKAVGIEIDPVRYWIARWNVWKIKEQYSSSKARSSLRHPELDSGSPSGSRVKPGMTDIVLLRKNFFDVNLSQATVIFLYLVPAALKRLMPKFLKELKAGTKFLSYVYPMPEEMFKGKLKLIEYDKENKVYFYKLT